MRFSSFRIVAAGTAAAMAVALTACSSSSDSAESASSGSPVSDEPVAITYTNFISNGGNEENLDTIIAAFEEQNPSITIEVTTLPYADYFTALQTDLVAGTQADVFDLEYANYAAYQAAGVLAPLEGVDTSLYVESLISAYQTDGVQYALPSSFSTVVLFYNKTLFDEAGVDYPTADWTWAEEKAAAEKLTDSEAGVWGDYQPITYNEYYKAVAQAGGEFLSADNTEVGFDSDAGRAAAAWLVDKSGTVMPSAEEGAGTADFDSALFKDGKLAMWHSGIWMFSSLADVPFEWDIAVEPGDTTHASAMFSNAVGVSSASEHPEAAQKWATFLTSSTETVDVRLDAGWEIPPVADQSLLTPYLSAGAPSNRQAVFDSLDQVVLAPSIGDNQAQMQDVVTEQLSEAAAGRQTSDEAVSAAAAAVAGLLP